jgi:hypothetical protein
MEESSNIQDKGEQNNEIELYDEWCVAIAIPENRANVHRNSYIQDQSRRWLFNNLEQLQHEYKQWEKNWAMKNNWASYWSKIKR